MSDDLEHVKSGYEECTFPGAIRRAICDSGLSSSVLVIYPKLVFLVHSVHLDYEQSSPNDA